jgi:ferredoxin--NADP+ reductase
MAVQWKKATVKKKTIWAEGLFTLTLDVPGVQPFEPGQFLQVGVENGEQHIHRPYSVASPHGPELEFYIVLVEDGELTPRLWAMEEGSQLDVSERAAGSFTLSKTPDAKHLWLIATGTGLAPYIAMLRTEEPWQRYEKIVLVHGVRMHADLSYGEELRGCERNRGGQFKYLPILTREDMPGILRGRIPACLENGSLEQEAGCQLSAADSAVLLCGNPQMLDDMEAKLAERNMRRHRRKEPGQIVLERYW